MYLLLCYSACKSLLLEHIIVEMKNISVKWSFLNFSVCLSIITLIVIGSKESALFSV